ncbi:MAG TPA: hypothetical protein VF167_17195 [Longimicrobiaceae bacterium]
MHQTVPRSGAAGTSLFLLGLALTSCDLPTELPDWDTRWVIPVDRTTITARSIVTGDAGGGDEGEAFELELPGISVTRSLGEICPLCGPLDGRTVPKPAFDVSVSSGVPLPEELISARLEGGELAIAIQHDFPFDPLRPGGDEPGTLVLTVRSGSALLARDSIDGREVALPPGTVLRRTLPLRAAEVAAPLEVTATLRSPAGDPVTIDLTDRFLLELSARVALAEVRLRLRDREVASDPILLALNEIDDAAAERLRGGAVLIELENPFELTADLDLHITAGGAQITKPLEVAPGSSELRIDLTRDEARAIVGQAEVVFEFAGRVSSGDEGTVIRPDDEVSLTTALEMVVGSRREQ